MSILSCLFSLDINRGLRDFRDTPGAILLDVRPQYQHLRRRIPQSENLPLENLDQARERFPDRSVPLFVYAYGGDKSAKAASQLKAMGYTNVRDIGGIKRCCGNRGYDGPVEGTRWQKPAP